MGSMVLWGIPPHIYPDIAVQALYFLDPNTLLCACSPFHLHPWNTFSLSKCRTCYYAKQNHV